MDHYYKDDYIENIINEYDENNDTEDGIDLENESDDNDDKQDRFSIFDWLNDFISDHLELVLPCVLVVMLATLAIPFAVTAYFSQEKYLETKSDTTLTYTIVDKTVTTSGSGDNMRTYYHVIVKNPETNQNKVFNCSSGLYASIVVGEPLNIREKVVYNTHYKTTDTEYTANGTNLYG